jgi:hypothetical protein
MVAKVTQRLNYANVMATVAVFLALGGSAFAIKLARNSVGSKQVKNNSLKGKDIRESSLGQVPKAASATNAGKLDGLDSSAFGAGFLTGHINGLTTVTNTNDTGAASGISTAGASDLPTVMLAPNVPIIASDLSVRVSTPPGAGASRTFYIQIDTGPTAVSCPISGTSTTCNSGAASAVIPAGSVVELREDIGSNAPLPADAWFGWRAQPAS